MKSTGRERRCTSLSRRGREKQQPESKQPGSCGKRKLKERRRKSSRNLNDKTIDIRILLTNAESYAKDYKISDIIFKNILDL